MTFEEFMKTEMLPAECDDERVIVGMRLAFEAGIEEGVKICKNANVSRAN